MKAQIESTAEVATITSADGHKMTPNSEARKMPMPDSFYKAMETHMGHMADALIKIIHDHESREHEGESCLAERANTIAFIAHKLGLTSDRESDWCSVRRILKEVYEARHDRVYRA